MAQQPVLPPPPVAQTVDANNVQGDIIEGLHKRVQSFVFFNIRDPAAFKRHLLADILPSITTAQDVRDFAAKVTDQRALTGRHIWLSDVFANIAFTWAGLKKLGVTESPAPPIAPRPGAPATSAFETGQKADAAGLGDASDSAGTLKTWKPEFLRDVDAVITITASRFDEIWIKLEQLFLRLGVSVQILHEVEGHVRPGSSCGHEHFGFRDGLTTPKINGFNASATSAESGNVDRSVILLGQDPAVNPAWAADGSFLVFRQLQQLVPEFDDFLKKAAPIGTPTGGLTPEFIGARMVGRWKSGAPVVLAVAQDDRKLATRQDFDYSNDLDQIKCPYAAHVRKTNPRHGLGPKFPAPTAVLPHLIVRQGIPYGPEVSWAERKSGKTEKERGLLFACYQSRIENGFEFLQKVWCNNPKFPNPDGTNAAGVTPGLDPIIGQGVRTTQGIFTGQGENTNQHNCIQPPTFVVPRGGYYFFSPSIKALRTTLSAPLTV